MEPSPHTYTYYPTDEKLLGCKKIIFINGLKPELRDFVITNKPKNFMEAVQTAKLKEALTKGVISTKAKSPAEKTTLNSMSHVKEKFTEDTSTSELIENFTKSI